MALTQQQIQGLQGISDTLSQIQLTLGGLKSQGVTTIPTPPTPPSLAQSSSAASYSTPSSSASYSVPSSAINYSGPSVVDYLNLSKQPSDFSSRAKLAQQYGIQNYIGSAEQNTQLLNSLKSGQKPTTTQQPATQPSIQQPVQQPPITYPTIAEQQPTTTDRINDYIKQYIEPIDYDDLASQAKQIVEQNYTPVQEALKQVTDNIKAQYDSLKQDLTAKQQQELEDLRGDYSTRGLLDSGAYTEARRKLQETQAKELADTEQKEAQDIANVHYSAISQMPQDVFDITQSLASELQGRRNEAISLLGDLFITEENKATQEQAAQKEVSSTAEIVDENGNKYVILLNKKGQEVGRIYAGKSTTAPEVVGSQETGYYQYDPNTGSWKQVIGGTGGETTDKLLSVSEATALGVPYGTTKSQAVGIVPTSQATRNTINTLNKADIIANQIEQAINKLNLADNWIEAPVRGAALTGGVATKTNVDAVAYNALSTGLLSQLARATGEVGVLTDQDIQRVKSLLPSFYDTKATAKAKIDQLRNFFGELKSSVSNAEIGSTSTSTSTPSQTNLGELNFKL